MVPSLDVPQFQQLLQLTLMLSGSHDFEKDVMVLLKNVIDFNSGMFITLTKNALPLNIEQYNIEMNMAEDYTSKFYRYDPILNYSNRMSENLNAQRIISFSVNEPSNISPEFIQYLSTRQISHCLFITFNDNGDGFRLFRKNTMPQFSLKDEEKARYLSSILGTLYSLCKVNKEYYMGSKLFNITKNNMLFGFIIFDQNFSLIFSNKLAYERIYKITQKYILEDMINSFIEMIKNAMSDPDSKKTDSTFYLITESYIVEIIINQDIDESGNISKYYIGYLYDKYWFGSMLRLSAEKVIEKYTLTEREKQLVLMIYKGFNNSQIAEMLHISTYTVKNHIKSIFKKLDLCSRAELMAKIFNDCG